MINRRFLKKLMVISAITLTLAITAACGKKNEETSQNQTEKVTEKATVSEKTSQLAKEESKRTDVVAFTMTDTEGNEVSVEGVAVTDDKGNTVITVKGDDGDVVINAKAETGSDGSIVIKDPVITNGGTITKSDGTTVDVSEETTVGEVVDNNDNTVETDVAVSDDTKEQVKQEQTHEQEVADAKEEVTKAEEATQAQTQTQAPTEHTPKLVKEAWDETVVDVPEHEEQRLVKAAWTETKTIPAEYEEKYYPEECYEKIMLDTRSMHFVGYGGMDYGSINSKNPEAYIVSEVMDEAVSANLAGVCPSDPLVAFFYSGKIDDSGYYTRGNTKDFKLVHHNAGVERTEISPERTETINHEAEYETITVPATYKTIHHDAIYE